MTSTPRSRAPEQREDAAPHTADDYVDFDAFVRAQTPRLLAYAVVLTGERAQAADVVQDALVRAYTQWSRVCSADRPDLYVKRIVTNEFLSWRRRWHVRAVTAPGGDVVDALAPRVDDPAAALAEHDALWRRLSALPARQRAVLVLRFYEDLQDDEIAQVLHMATGTVRSNASRGLAALRLTPAPEESL